MMSACPPWCTGRHATPAAPHWRDIGVITGPHLVTSLVVMQDGGRAFVRLFLDGEHGVRHHDLPPALAADLGRVLAGLAPAVVAELGRALTAGAELLADTLMDQKDEQ